ncbi:MAG TPA: ATP-binding protein [Oscillospiraceae bacterium]|nr:ATP-binding protein [Oscillospiraceae bacterium]
MDNNASGLINRFFSERSFPMRTKVGVYALALTATLALAYLTLSGSFSDSETRLILYLFHISIFTTTFFCGLIPGIVTATISTIVAINSLGENWLMLNKITFKEAEIFPFIALYFLVAITVDLFSEHIEKLEKQLVEIEQLHETTRQMEKLALAGQIAAGIAHEIRNPITVVHGYLQLLTSKQPVVDENYQLMLDELKRANQIITDFLRFSRPGELRKVPVQLNHILETTVSLMVGQEIQNDVKIKTKLADYLPIILLDRSQMLQVFLNLFTNAIQAMPAGGIITVSSEFDQEANVIRVIIKDTGTGIKPEAMPQIFDPFFSTKDQGTGLGLAITQTIVAAHDGQIEAQSKLKEGTQFTLTFPVPVE